MKKVLILCILIAIPICILVNYFQSDPYSRGIEAYENGKYDKSLKYLYKSLSKRKSDPEIYLQIAKICLYNTKNLNESEKILEKGLELFPNNFQLCYEMMVLYFEKCNVKDGIDMYIKLSNLSSKKPYSITWKAITCMEDQLSQSDFKSEVSNLLKYNNHDCVISRIIAGESYNEKKYYEFLVFMDILQECGELLSVDYFSQGVAYYYLGNRELSLQNFRKAYSLGVDAANFYSKSLLGVSLETERSPVTEGSLDPSDRTEK